MDDPARRGAFGLSLSGDLARSIDAHLVVAPPHWRDVELVRRDAADLAPAPGVLTPEVARFAIAGSGLTVKRADRSAELLTGAEDPTALLIHPWLTVLGSVFAHWDGEATFHGGALATPEGAWALLADRGGGKTTFLAGLHARGSSILADDGVVLRGDRVLSGPRTLDLRGDMAARLGAPADTYVVDRERFRLATGPAPAESPLRGFVLLDWGDEIAVSRLPPAARPAALLAHRTWYEEPPRPESYLPLLGLPVYRLARPRHWDATEHALDAFHHLISAA